MAHEVAVRVFESWIGVHVVQSVGRQETDRSDGNHSRLVSRIDRISHVIPIRSRAVNFVLDIQKIVLETSVSTEQVDDRCKSQNKKHDSGRNADDHAVARVVRVPRCARSIFHDAPFKNGNIAVLAGVAELANAAVRRMTEVVVIGWTETSLHAVVAVVTIRTDLFAL